MLAKLIIIFLNLSTLLCYGLRASWRRPAVGSYLFSSSMKDDFFDLDDMPDFAFDTQTPADQTLISRKPLEKPLDVEPWDDPKIKQLLKEQGIDIQSLLGLRKEVLQPKEEKYSSVKNKMSVKASKSEASVADSNPSTSTSKPKAVAAVEKKVQRQWSLDDLDDMGDLDDLSDFGLPKNLDDIPDFDDLDEEEPKPEAKKRVVKSTKAGTEAAPKAAAKTTKKVASLKETEDVSTKTAIKGSIPSQWCLDDLDDFDLPQDLDDIPDLDDLEPKPEVKKRVVKSAKADTEEAPKAAAKTTKKVAPKEETESSDPVAKVATRKRVSPTADSDTVKVKVTKSKAKVVEEGDENVVKLVKKASEEEETPVAKKKRVVKQDAEADESGEVIKSTVKKTVTKKKSV